MLADVRLCGGVPDAEVILYRLTRLATLRPALRAWRNLLLSTMFRLPLVRRQLAWRLSGLVYR